MQVLMVFALLPGVVAGWLLKGRLVGLGQLRLRWVWLIISGLAVQVLAMGYFVGRSPALAALRPGILIATYLLVLAGLWRNWRIPGMALVALGFVLNFTVMAANGGQMPTNRGTVEASGQGSLLANIHDGQPIWRSKDILLPKEQTRLWQLSDIIITPPPARRAASLGDFVTCAGVALVIALAMRDAKTDRRAAETLSSAA